MPELIDSIKEMAHQVAEDYLLLDKDMNDSLVSLYQNGDIENDEILKRVCEFANQNVYLSMFHNPAISSSNISFDMAKSSRVLVDAQESEDSMINYDTPPKDFRSEMDIEVTPRSTEESEGEKLASLNVAIEYRQVLRNFLSRVETMKTASEYGAENAFNRMSSDAKVLIAKGNSIGDLSKIACRYVKEDMEGDFEKVAKSYVLIHESLIKGGFHVKTGFTKLSSQRINTKADVLIPVREFALSLSKVAGFVEMENNIRAKLEIFDKVMSL